MSPRVIHKKAAYWPIAAASAGRTAAALLKYSSALFTAEKRTLETATKDGMFLGEDCHSYQRFELSPVVVMADGKEELGEIGEEKGVVGVRRHSRMVLELCSEVLDVFVV